MSYEHIQTEPDYPDWRVQDHLVLPFEDQGETYYVVRYYGKHKQWWHYEVWDSWTMAFNKERGYMNAKNPKMPFFFFSPRRCVLF